MSFEWLNQFDKIGWDFDGTLIQHEASPLMHQYILDHPEKQHFVITFRTHGMQRTAFAELQMMYPDGLDQSHFSGLFNIEDKAWEMFSTSQRERMAGLRKGPFRSWELYYLTWKGHTCKQHSIPVLVDDMSELVLPGCEKYGVKYIHPDDLLGEG